LPPSLCQSGIAEAPMPLWHWPMVIEIIYYSMSHCTDQAIRKVIIVEHKITKPLAASALILVCPLPEDNGNNTILEIYSSLIHMY
jgi:hypothetical protein